MAKEKKGKIITITSMKGGVGKTITTLLLASIYENLDKKVLILDLDLSSGDIAFCLNADIKNTIFNVCDDMNNNRFKSITNGDYICHYSKNLDVLAAPKDPRYASKIDRRCLEILLESLSNYYDVVLIDTNHVLDLYSMLAFSYSDKIINIFTNDAMDLKSTKNFVSICKNVEVNNYMLVLNESIDSSKTYFSNYSVSTLLSHEIDFIISSSLHIHDLDMSIMDNNLYRLLLNVRKKEKKAYEHLEGFAKELINNSDRGDENEEK